MTKPNEAIIQQQKQNKHSWAWYLYVFALEYIVRPITEWSLVGLVLSSQTPPHHSSQCAGTAAHFTGRESTRRKALESSHLADD